MKNHYARPFLATALAAGLLGLVAPTATADVTDVDLQGDVADALDLPAGVTVAKGGTAPDQMIGTSSRSYNDFPRRGSSSYAVMSTGRATDLFNMNLPGLQANTSLGGARDTASLTFTVDPSASGSCLLVDVAMATEERVHTFLPSAPSDNASLTLNGSTKQYAMNPGPRYFEQQGLAAKPVAFEVNKVDYWHQINEEFERQPDDADEPLLAAVTPFDNFSSVETFEVPLTDNPGDVADVVTLGLSDANNDSLDTALMVDRVRLAPVCSGSASAETGLYPTRAFTIVGHRGMHNILTVDLFPETDEIERYDAADNSWFPAGEVDLRFRWYRGACSSMPSAATAIPDADRQTYSPTVEDEGKCLMVLVTGLKDGFRTETFPSPNNWPQAVTLPIQKGVFTNEQAPTITKIGDPDVIKVNDQLTATNGVFTPRPDTYEYQWYADDRPISGETGQSFKVTSDQAGKRLAVRVTAQRLNFDALPKFSPESSPVQLLELTATPTPQVTGTGRANDVLTGVPGTWGPDPVALSYQWYADGTPITGATKLTYTPTAAQVNRQVRLAVTGTRAGYRSVTQQSDPILITLQGFNAPRPTIGGTPLAGNQVQAVTGTWSPTPTTFVYQWLLDGEPISGATRSVYTLTSAQAGRQVTVEVTGKSTGYTDTTRVSDPVVVGLKDFTVNGNPTIIGDGLVGSQLSVDRGVWDPTPGFSYKWYADGNEILGATRSTFTPSDAERGKSVTVKVTGSLTNYRTQERMSAPIDIDIRRFIAGRPAITGSLKVGQRVNAAPGSWLPSASYTYVWKLNGVVLSRYSYLTIPATAAGKRLTLEVTGKKSLYLTTTVTTTSAVVARGTLTATGPRITGTPKAGKTLRATGTWRPSGVTLRYQWYLGTKAIRGATKSSYKVPKKYRNKKIRVRVTGYKSGYTTLARYSSYKRISKR